MSIRAIANRPPELDSLSSYSIVYPPHPHYNPSQLRSLSLHLQPEFCRLKVLLSPHARQHL